MARSLRVLLLNVLLLALHWPLYAQVYPVQVTPRLLPPYTLNVSDYHMGTTEKLVVLLTNTDLSKPTLQVRLKMSIQGQNAKLINRDEMYYPPITLDAGVPLRVSLNDLAPYFNADNLVLQGITRAQYLQTKKLPEGFYQFCFEVYEYNTNRLIGRSNCAMAWLSLLDPPLLNLPRNGESIAWKEPTNIIFQWTPRNMGSPTAAFNTEYEFTVVELWDNAIAPAAAFGTSQPLYRTTTQATTLLYGPTEPLLIPGKRYGWRIRAQASDGSQNSDTYRNNGYSEIFWFTYQQDCPMPFNVQSEVSGGRASITWNAALQQSRFVVEYREKGQTANQWYSVNSSVNRVMLYDLKKDKQYEYRVGAFCDVNDNAPYPANGAVYSDIKSFVINGSSLEEGAGCNILQPELTVANRTPIQTLMSGDVITAGDFPVKLITVQGQGAFAGTGYITIPFIGKVAVKVRFSSITVNTDKQLIGGIIETTYDQEEKQLTDITDFTGDPKSVAILRELKDHIPEAATATLDELKEFIDKLAEVSPNTIDNALALTPSEKQQLKEYINQMKEAKDVLDDENATPQQKAEAEQKLREAVKNAGPIVQKLGETIGKGLQSVVSKWFQNVREFFKGYKGTDADKQQATQWRRTTDSLVTILMKSKNVPQRLLDSLDRATRAASGAWLALERATPCNGVAYLMPRSGPNIGEKFMNDFDCYTALGNAQYDVIDKVYEASVNNLFDTENDILYDELIIRNTMVDGIIYTPDGKKYKANGVLLNYHVDLNGALTSFTYNNRAYVACYNFNRKTGQQRAFKGYVDSESVVAIKDSAGYFSWEKAEADGFVFQIDKYWDLQEANADKVKMMEYAFETHQKSLTNDSPEIRKEILDLIRQLPSHIFVITKDENYVGYRDLEKLRDMLRGQLNIVTKAVTDIQVLIDEYKKIRGNRSAEQMQNLFDSNDPAWKIRCDITKALQEWNVSLVNHSSHFPALGCFEKLSRDQRLDLLQIMFEQPNLTTSQLGTGKYCQFTNYGEEIVIALLKFAPDADKGAIIGYFKSNAKVLPRLYKKIDNKNILMNDTNFDAFIREVIKANVVYLAAKNEKPKPDAPTILWKSGEGLELVKCVSFTDDGKVVINYATFDLSVKSIILPMILPGMGSLSGLSFQKSKAVEPLETINLVIPEPDEKYFPELKNVAKFPYTIQIPAISAAWMVNKVTNDKIQLGIDLALIALSAGEYAAAKGALQYIWVSTKIAVPLANELMSQPAGRRAIERLYGVEEPNISLAEKEKRKARAETFITNYGIFTNLVNAGAMGEGMYSVYKSVRGSVGDMKSLGIADESGIMSKMETDLNNFDDAIPTEMRMGKLGDNVLGESALARQLSSGKYSFISRHLDAMDNATRLKFMEDFGNASEDVLKALNKQSSELMDSWKGFRKKYPKEVLCQ